MLTPAPLPAFDPPYFIGGSAFVAVCVAHTRAASAGANPVHLGLNRARPFPTLRGLCVVVVADYTAPPAALPIPYRELIVAKPALTWRGLVSRPLVMRLDAPAPVALGIEHYAMPKELDPSLRLTGERGRVELAGAGLRLAFRWRAGVSARLSAPLCALLTLAVYAFTRLVPLLSARAERRVRALVVLHPRARAELVTLEHAQLGAAALWPLVALHLPRVFSELGPPSPRSSEAP